MFRIAFVVPTGIGAALGGFAGDAGILVRYLSGIADEILTHPNVVNASGFNVLPANALYIEGYALDQFFLKKLGFNKVRQNKIALVIDQRCAPWLSLIENAVNATSVSTGCTVLGYELTQEPLKIGIFKNDWGYTGKVDNLEFLVEAGQKCLAQGAEALAVLTWMDILPETDTAGYSQGVGVDPIGALEALISHAMVSKLGVPVAHSPIFKPQIVTKKLDPRVAAEEIGTTFLPCILMGLARAPQLVDYNASDFQLEDLQALVVPAGACGGIPMLSAAEAGIPVISVGENTTVLNVSLESLGWQSPHIYHVDNYWEAAGLLLALKEGINPQVLRRPIMNCFRSLSEF